MQSPYPGAANAHGCTTSRTRARRGAEGREGPVLFAACTHKDGPAELRHEDGELAASDAPSRAPRECPLRVGPALVRLGDEPR